jgi:hypothetical protein
VLVHNTRQFGAPARGARLSARKRQAEEFGSRPQVAAGIPTYHNAQTAHSGAARCESGIIP